MKSFYATIIVIFFAHITTAQTSFFVSHNKPKPSAMVQRWLKENNYASISDSTKATHVIFCEEINTGMFSETLIYFSIWERTSKKTIGQTKTRIVIGNLAANYYLLAQENLKSVLGLIGSGNKLSVTLKDTSITVVRPQKIPTIIRTEVVVANLSNTPSENRDAEKDKPKTNDEKQPQGKDIHQVNKQASSKTVTYYLAFDVFNSEIDFKNYNSTPIDTKYDGSFPIEIILKADTTIKDKREYKVQLYYRDESDKPFQLGKSFKITVLPEAKKPEGTFHKNELVLFTGTTYDHFNISNKISGLSIEPMASFKFAKRLWAKFGVYVHPNFSRDTSASRRGGYYKLNNAPLTDTSLIGYSSELLAVGRKVQSIGFYGDIFVTPRENSTFYEKGTRVSPLGHFEFIKRTVTPTTSVSPLFGDTIVYDREFFEKNNIRIAPQKPDSKSFRAPKYVANQFVFAVGSLIEADVSGFYFYCQPMLGMLWQFTDYYEQIPPSDKIQRCVTYAMKLGVRYKNIISLSIDSRDLLSKNNSYLNISFGIPITIAEFTKK